MIQTSFWSQRDKEWAGRKMSPSEHTVGEIGCLMTCVANSLKNFAIPDDVGVVLTKLIKANALMPSGDLDYGGLMRAYPQLYFHDRVYTTALPDKNVTKLDVMVAIANIKKLLKLGQPVHLHVDAIANDKRPDHFVLAYSWDKDGLWIVDPWDGAMIKFSERYGLPEQGIFGYAVIIGPPIAFPDNGYPAEGQACFKLSQAVKGINKDAYIKDALKDLIG